jgi:hypothetical protein
LGSLPYRDEPRSAALQLAAKVLELPSLAIDASLDIEESDNRDLAFLKRLVDFCRSEPHLPNLGRIQEHFRGTEYDATLTRAIHADSWKMDTLTEGELAVEFRDGVAKLRAHLQHSDRNALIQRAKREGFTEEIKQTLRKTDLHV